MTNKPTHITRNGCTVKKPHDVNYKEKKRNLTPSYTTKIRKNQPIKNVG